MLPRFLQSFALDLLEAWSSMPSALWIPLVTDQDGLKINMSLNLITLQKVFRAIGSVYFRSLATINFFCLLRCKFSPGFLSCFTTQNVFLRDLGAIPLKYNPQERAQPVGQWEPNFRQHQLTNRIVLFPLAVFLLRPSSIFSEAHPST